MGYIEVDSAYLNQVAQIEKVIDEILLNYNSKNNQENLVYVGKQGLEKFVNQLRYMSLDDMSSLDEYSFELIASRHKLLNMNLVKCKSDRKVTPICTSLLENLSVRWRVLRSLLLKQKIIQIDDVRDRMAKKIDKEIIPTTAEFMKCLAILSD